MKIRIPEENGDIKVAVRRRLISDILFIVLVRVIVFMPAYLYGYYTEPNIGGIIAVELVCLFPFIKTRFWKWFTSARAFEGEVINIEHRRGNKVTKHPEMGLQQTPTKAMRRTPVAGRSRQVIKVNIQKIQVRLPNGKIRRVRYAFPDGSRPMEYKVGDRVRHYYGTGYMLKLAKNDGLYYEDTPSTPKICVMCGKVNPAERDTCEACEMTLIEHNAN